MPLDRPSGRRGEGRGQSVKLGKTHQIAPLRKKPFAISVALEDRFLPTTPVEHKCRDSQADPSCELTIKSIVKS